MGLEDYSDLYEEMKEVFNASTTNEEQKRKLCISFINLISHHLNFHINKFGIEGHYIWSQLDTSMDYFYKILKELDLSNELKVRIYEKYIEVLEIQIRVYDKFSEYATNSKETLRKALNRIKTEKEKCEKNK